MSIVLAVFASSHEAHLKSVFGRHLSHDEVVIKKAEEVADLEGSDGFFAWVPEETDLQELVCDILEAALKSGNPVTVFRDCDSLIPALEAILSGINSCASWQAGTTELVARCKLPKLAPATV